MNLKKRALSGGAKLRLAGKKAVLLGMLPTDLALLRNAAEIEMRPVTQFVTYHALEAAKVVTALYPMESKHVSHHLKQTARRPKPGKTDQKKKPTRRTAKVDRRGDQKGKRPTRGHAASAGG